LIDHDIDAEVFHRRSVLADLRRCQKSGRLWF
jgi:hypothetical protein